MTTTTTTEALVARTISGDVEAFGDLVQRYQAMAFAYALATLRDYQLAEDATQQATITAYRNLTSLREPRRFGGWLRGIVRFECLRVLRDRHRQQVESLDAQEAIDPADPAVDLEHQAEISAEVQHLLRLMAQLPERQRVVAQLYYLGDQSQVAVADFLGLSVNAVNNRLREARIILRREGDQIMDIPIVHPPDIAGAIGHVIASGGLTIDARIDGDARPPFLTSVRVGEADRAVTAFIAQYLDDDVARLVVSDQPSGVAGVVRGAAVRSQGADIAVADGAADAVASTVLVSADAIAQLLAVSTSTDAAAEPTAIPTGIKVVDCFAPLVGGGTVALVGAMNVGKLVVVEELARRLAATGERATILVFLKSPDELRVAHQLDVRVSGAVGVVVVPVADASPEALASSLDRVDTVLAMSKALGGANMYPAIDPLASRSNTVAISAIAEQAKNALSSGDDDARTRLLRAYLTQPFFVAEPYTGRPGVSIDLAEAEADVARLIGGDVSGLEADTLLMGGSLADINGIARG